MRRRLLPLALLLLCACAKVEPAEPQKLGVAASFYPLAYIAERIGGDTIAVTQVTPGGVEPHEYEPSPKQLVAIHTAKLFLMNGHGVDAWADKIKDTLTEEGVTVLVATESVELLELHAEHAHEDEEEEHTEEKDMEKNNDAAPEVHYDPHVWLDPMVMRAFAIRVRDALVAADPEHAKTYRSNADRLLKDLSALDKKFKSELTKCELKKAIVSHDAFRYLAKRYGFETISLSGISPDEEPSAKDIADIIEIAKNEKVPVIFFESLVSPKLAESVANGAGAQILSLNPLEGLTEEDTAGKRTYISIMEENADHLSTGLACQK